MNRAFLVSTFGTRSEKLTNKKAVYMNRKQQIQLNSRRSKLTSIINETGGKFFAVKFHKVDGSIRKMNCRIGVHKFLKGGELSYLPVDKPNLRIVFDVKSSGYRTINLDKVFYIKTGRRAAITYLTDQLINDMTHPNYYN